MDDNRLQDQFDGDILDEALRLVRDCYGSADKSVYFLETYAGISAISGITNQRDCFSHLVTLLKNPQFSPEEQKRQIASMQEHLRRAVLEPPILAVNAMWEKFYDVREKYFNEVLTLPGRDSELPGCPTFEEVNARSASILSLREKARTGKGENRWDSAWEEACAEAVEAFQLLNGLKNQLEQYIGEAKRIRDTRASRNEARRYLWIGGAVGAAITIAVGWFFWWIS